MKFGGTSVANLDRIKNVANIVENHSKNNKIIVLVFYFRFRFAVHNATKFTPWLNNHCLADPEPLFL